MGKTYSFNTNSEPNKEETQEEHQLKCKHCEYKFKRKGTMNKHMNTKHSKQIVSCKQSKEKSNSTVLLELHIADKHQVRKEVVHGSSSLSKVQDYESFVFCESMLDEFINSSSSSKVNDNDNFVFCESMLNEFRNS